MSVIREGVQLDVEVVGDDEAVKSMGRLDEATESVESSAEEMGNEIAESSQKGARTISDMREEARQAGTALEQTADAQDEVASSSSRMAGSVGGANNLLFELTQGAQDAKFGMVGLANQVPLIAEQFGRLRQESGSTTGALGQLFSAVKGPTGIIAAFTLLLSFKDEIIGFFTDTEEAAQGAAEAAEGVDSVLRGRLSNLADERDLQEVNQIIAGIREEIEAFQDQQIPGEEITVGFQTAEGEFLRAEDAPPVLPEGAEAVTATERVEQLQIELENVRKRRQQIRKELGRANALRKAGIDLSEEQTEETGQQATALQEVLQEMEATIEAQRRMEELFGEHVSETEIVEGQIKAVRKAMREIANQDIEIDDSEVRRLSGRLNRLLIKKQQLEAPPQAKRVDTLRPGPSPEEIASRATDLEGIPRELGRRTSGLEQETEDSVAQGIRKGAERGFARGLQPLFEKTENAFFEAIQRALVRAAASAAAKRLADVLGGDGEGDPSGQDGGVFGNVIEGLITAASAALFDEGGFTGAGPRSEAAGVVHRGEYVMPADVVSRLGVGTMRQIHAAATAAPSRADLEAIAGVPQYATGGLVQAVTRPAGAAGGADRETAEQIRQLRGDVRDQTRRLEEVERQVVVGRRESRDIVETGESERSSKQPTQ